MPGFLDRLLSAVITVLTTPAGAADTVAVVIASLCFVAWVLSDGRRTRRLDRLLRAIRGRQ